MVKKMFALASVSALTGLMAAVAASGCTSTVEPPAAPGDAAVTDAKVVTPPKDALPPDAEDVQQTCPAPTPITAADIGLTWVAPGAPQAVCDQTNLDALKAVFAKGGGSAKYTDIEASLGATCGACVFTPIKGARWGVILKDGTKIAADNSSGSCYGQNAGDACGKAAFEIDACVDIACPQQECTDTAACTKKAVAKNGPCSAFASTFQAACPDVGDKCDNFIKTIVASCGGGPEAGTLDASL